jgi:hypothetical protein
MTRRCELINEHYSGCETVVASPRQLGSNHGIEQDRPVEARVEQGDFSPFPSQSLPVTAKPLPTTADHCQITADHCRSLTITDNH